MASITVSISDAAIKRHASDPAVTQLHDQSLGALYFRYHQSRETGSWYLVTRINGKKNWRRLARWPDVGATVMRREAPSLLARSEVASVAITAEKALGDVLAWYRDRAEHNQSLTPERRADVVGIVNNHLLCRPKLAGLPLNNLKRRDIDAALMQPLQHELATSTCSKVFRVLKAATKLAAVMDVTGHDPLAPFRFADFVSSRVQPKAASLRAGDATKVLERLDQVGPVARTLVLLMLLHGTRIGETRMARWRDFDLDGGWRHIPAINAKTRRALRLPLTDTARRVLTEYRTARPNTGPCLFPGEQGPLSKSHASALVRAVSKGEWTAHDLRKLARTVWVDLGIDYLVGEMLLNHAMRGLDSTYIHTYADLKRKDALQRYHQWLIEQSENSVLSGRQAGDYKTSA